MYFWSRRLIRPWFALLIVPLLIFTVTFPYVTISLGHVESATDKSLPFTTKSLPRSTRKLTDVPDIFEISLWRLILIGEQGNQTLCEVPPKYRPIANAYCHAQNRPDCPMIPCTLVYLSEEFTTYIECLRGGKVAIDVEPDWICRKSPALELFSGRRRKPSISAEAYTTLTSDLYGRALAPYRDDETSRWGFSLVGESVGYYPSVANGTRVSSLFDITIGYDRRLFDLITDVHLTEYVDQITNKDERRLKLSHVMRSKVQGRAPVLWINSNCNTPSNRTGYMLELMRYVKVDVRGKCGKSDQNDSSPITDPKTFAQQKMVLTGEYLFTVAIENSLEFDYVTEKLWQPLAAGSVPLYLGAPNIEEWLPCGDHPCIINLRQFPTVKDAGKFINDIAHNKLQYMMYHRWRSDQVKPSFIKMVNYFREANQHSLECLLCDMVHRRDRGAMRRKLLTSNNPFNDAFPSLA